MNTQTTLAVDRGTPGARRLRPLLENKIQEIFGLDLRSLAVFRIGLGLVLLGDLWVRSLYLQAHYTDDGILPRSALGTDGPATIHVLGGSWIFEGLLFLVAAGFALALLLGFRTRLATCISWFLLLSLHGRNPIILQGGDVLLRMLLFWGMFLPLGARWSLDSRRRPAGSRTGVISPGTVGLMLQIGFVYWFSAALKTDPVWRTEGTAVYYALNIDQLATPFGKYLLQFPQLLKVLTFSTLILEGVIPYLLFCPVYTTLLRLLVVAGFIGFHMGLNLCLELGPFSYIATVAWLALLPAGFWEVMASHAKPPRRQEDQEKKEFGEEETEKQPELSPVSPPGALAAWREILPREDDHLLTGLLATAAILYIFLWNLRTVDYEKYSRFFPPQVNSVGNTLGLGQIWDMFSPSPLRDDGWYVMEGTLRNGQQVDLWREGAPVSWEKPAAVAQMYPTERWRKYFLNFYWRDFSSYRPLYARYLWREWNAHHSPDEALTRLDIYFMRETTLPDYQVSTPEKILLFEYHGPEEEASPP
ncbi:MAG: HTTM domain-containing protein [Planctomycetes bacterium]|nr:HTTM domain-containing protein [Planctomycetota bacterium]